MPIDPSQLTYKVLCDEAQALWQKVSDLAELNLRDFVEGNSHEILVDIAKGDNIPWEDGDIHSLAKLIFHLSEVVACLDELRHKELKQARQKYAEGST